MPGRFENWDKAVFMAHVHEDQERVRALCAKLQSHGVAPWFDEEQLLPGDDWDSRIQSAIDQCRLFVACLSPASVTKEGYFQRELRTALARMERKPSGSVFFVPVLLEPVDVPDVTVGSSSINRYQYCRLYAKGGLDQLLRSLERVIPLTGWEPPRFSKTPSAVNGVTQGSAALDTYRSLFLVDTEDPSDRTQQELETLKLHFPRFKCQLVDPGRIAHVAGPLMTNKGKTYTVHLDVPPHYPYVPPRISIDEIRGQNHYPHTYIDGTICLMNLNQWSPTLSLSFMLVKATVWLKKLEIWEESGRWPGLHQIRASS